MTPELLPTRPGAAALSLGIEPFELVRLLVVSGDTGPLHSLTAERIEAVRSFAGLSAWWPDPTALPKDEIPGRGVIRGVLGQLLQRGFVGEKRTRQDNLWRGLPGHHRQVIEDAIDVLVEHGILASRTDAQGHLVAVRPEAAERVEAIVASRDIPEDLSRVWS